MTEKARRATRRAHIVMVPKVPRASLYKGPQRYLQAEMMDSKLVPQTQGVAESGDVPVPLFHEPRHLGGFMWSFKHRKPLLGRI